MLAPNCFDFLRLWARVAKKNLSFLSFEILSKLYIFLTKQSNVKSNVATSGMGTASVRYQAILWHIVVFVLSRTIWSLFRLEPLIFLEF